MGELNRINPLKTTNPKHKPFYPGDVPRKAGVYIFRDRFGKVIYVGKAVNLRKRMSQYFQSSRLNSADPKLRSLIKSINSWEFFPVKNEAESLIFEARLIKEYSPHYNILMRDDKRYLLLKIDLGEKFPLLRLARVKKSDNCEYFGPFPKSGVLRETVDFLTRYFGLRSCKALLPSEKDRRHCLASRIRDCCEPCIAKASPEQYAERVSLLMEVFRGKTQHIVSELRKQMEECSMSKNFERAAKYRDMISNIEEIFGKKSRSFRFASIFSSAGNEAVSDLQKALGLKNAPHIIEAFDVSNIGGKLAVASIVCFVSGKPDRRHYRRLKIREVEQMDDVAMMKEAVKRHYIKKLDTGTKALMPDLLVADGGKGQLNAVLSALVGIGYPPVSVVGLAKKNEEIFVPGRLETVILDRHSPALRLLQAIRDEAHRFALTYHRKLREKRLQESVLDEIPGIGPIRKNALLREFGSIEKLQHADAKEIAVRIPNIGRKLAEAIHKYLIAGLRR